MTRVGALGVLCVVLSSPPARPASDEASPQPPPPGSAAASSFPSRVDLITVDTVVLDAKGNPVPGLTRDDFTIEEDGEVREVVAFEALGGPHARGIGPGPSASTDVGRHERRVGASRGNDVPARIRRHPPGEHQRVHRADDLRTFPAGIGRRWRPRPHRLHRHRRRLERHVAGRSRRSPRLRGHASGPSHGARAHDGARCAAHCRLFG